MEELIKIKVGKSVFSLPKGKPLFDLLPQLGLEDRPLLFRCGQELLDLSYPADHDLELEPVTAGQPEALDILWHSASHLLAQAVLDLFPGVQAGIGPATDTGFYYDFLRDTAFTPDDLIAIENRMREIVEQDLPIRRLVLKKKKRCGFLPSAARPLKWN